MSESDRRHHGSQEGVTPACARSLDRALRTVFHMCAALSICGIISAVPARAQTVTSDSIHPWLMPVPGTTAERYVRSLEVGGLRPTRSVAVRDGFEQWVVIEGSGPRESGPWGGVYRSVPAGSTRWGPLPARAMTAFNSAFPYQRGEGPVWFGRGFTYAVEAGVHVRWGALRAVLNPMWFRAENEPFELAETRSGEGDYVLQSPLQTAGLDVPQRFGFGAYEGLAWGSSTLRLDVAGASLGLSAAPQKWGPADLHPLVLGDAAGGVPHLFAGTQRPIRVLIGRLSARYVAARTRQSQWSTEGGLARERLLNGLVIALQPRGLKGLEVGGTRRFHSPWPQVGSEMEALLLRPFEGLLKGGLSETDRRADDQFASIFFRWVQPSAHFEIFGEYARVDHSWDARVAVLEPDDIAGYTLGFRKVWVLDSQHMTALRGESITSGSTHRERGGARLTLAERAFVFYSGAGGLGGLTHRGLILSSTAGAYGNAQSLGLDRYSPVGRWTLEVDRTVVRDETLGVAPDEPSGPDVLYAFTGEFSRFVGAWDVEVSSSWLLNLNRYLARDASSVRFRLIVSRRFGRPPL